MYEFFYSELQKQAKEAFLWSPVCFAIGIIIYFSLADEPDYYVPLGAVLSAFMLLVSFWRQEYCRYIAIGVLLVSIGFGAAYVRTHIVYTPILKKKIQPVEVIGTVVYAEPLEEGRGQRLILDDLQIEDLGHGEVPEHIRVSFRGDAAYHTGQRLKFLGGLSPPSPPLFPGGFDFQRYMYFQRIGAVGFAFGKVQLLSGHEGGNVSSALREGVQMRVMDSVTVAPAFAAAMLTGERGAIAEQNQEAMRRSGLAHMLAISGLHIGLFSGVVFFLVRLGLSCFPAIALRYPIKKIAAVVGMGAAVFYMMMAGASIPSQRAVLMALIVYLAILLDRTPLSMRLVAFAALVVLAIAPESLLGVSFQLSFAAVAALIAFYEWSRGFWRATYKREGIFMRGGLYLLGVSATTVIATIATAPFSLFHFQQLAVYSLLANILAMPVLSFIVMPCAVLAYFLMPFGLDGWALHGMGYGGDVILRIARYVSQMEGAVWNVSQWPYEVLVYGSTAFVMIVVVKGWAKLVAIVPFAVAIFYIAGGSLPFFIVNGTGKLAAVYDGEQVAYSTLRREKFTREVWQRSFGLDGIEPLSWPDEGVSDMGGLSCGGGGCRVMQAGVVVDFIRHAKDVSIACSGDVDVIAVAEPVKNGAQDECGGRIIDLYDLRNDGAHGIYPDGQGGYQVRATETERGFRPWTVKYQQVRMRKQGKEQQP